MITVDKADAPRRAALLIVGAMALIGLIDSFVPRIAAEAGLWQFHAVRTAMALPVLALVATLAKWRVWPKRPAAVLARSLFVGGAMLIYFGCLAVLPIGQVAAGLFTSPMFVLMISVAVLGQRIGRNRILAVALGFVGILAILQPGGEGVSVLAALPVLAGLLYAVGVIGTRHWCDGESTASLITGFFLVLGGAGAVGAGVLAVLPVDPALAARPGAAFVLRPWVATPGADFWIWTAVQAFGSLVAIGMLTRGYQLANATRLAAYEYALLVFGPLWAFALRGETLGPSVLAGMAIIVTSGLILSRSAEERQPA